MLFIQFPLNMLKINQDLTTQGITDLNHSHDWPIPTTWPHRRTSSNSHPRLIPIYDPSPHFPPNRPTFRLRVLSMKSRASDSPSEAWRGMIVTALFSGSPGTICQ